MNDRGWGYQLLGCFLAATGIFLPTFLLGISFYPFWENIQQYERVQHIMTGVNAAVVGIMTASIIYLFKDTVTPFFTKPPLDALLFSLFFYNPFSPLSYQGICSIDCRGLFFVGSFIGRPIYNIRLLESPH